MKKLLVLVILFAGSYAFAQNYPQQQTQQPQQQPQGQYQTQQQVPPPPPPAPRPVSTGPSVRLHGYSLYAFDDKVDSYYSTTEYFEGKIQGGFEWGGGLEVLIHPAYGIEFTYLRLDSDAPMEYYDNGIKNTTFALASNYIMLSANRYLVGNPKVEPYAGLQLGMCVFNIDNPDNGESGSATKFAWGFRAGANIWASEKVGIKIQAGLLSAVQSVGGGFYFGTGGAGAGMTGYSSFYQFNLGGGLVFKIK